MTTRPKAATFGVGRQVILRPAVQKRYVELSEPSLADQRTDSQRVFDELDDLELTVDLEVYRTLGKTLRESDYKVTAVVVDDRLIAVEPGDTTARSFGLAFDLGTTTVVANLMDITTGTPAAVTSMLNKQQPYGADVIARISATMLDADALGHLQQLAHETLDTLAKEACAEAGVDAHEIYEVALAGNATMVQLALGIDPEPLGVAPFILAARQFENVMASDLGVDDPPAGASDRGPVARRLRRRRHHRRCAGVRHGPRQAAPALHRHRHQLRDRRRRRRTHHGDRGTGRAGLRGGLDPVRHARGPRGHRGGQGHRRRARAAGDRRRARRRCLRLGARGRGGRAGAGRA